VPSFRPQFKCIVKRSRIVPIIARQMIIAARAARPHASAATSCALALFEAMVLSYGQKCGTEEVLYDITEAVAVPSYFRLSESLLRLLELKIKPDYKSDDTDSTLAQSLMTIPPVCTSSSIEKFEIFFWSVHVF
jgi:hypothetical protein